MATSSDVKAQATMGVGGKSGTVDSDAMTSKRSLAARLPVLLRGESRGDRGASMESTITEDESDDDVGGIERRHCCVIHRMRCGKGRCGICYWCYVLVFLAFVIVFPLFLKWMLTYPMPLNWWHSEYAKFPVLADQEWVMLNKGSAFSISMSAIPTTWSGCNHTCSADWSGMESPEMNFDVEMQFSAPGFEHTTYPVLLASNDFKKWWVASDKRDAGPTPYFASSQDAGNAESWRHVTDNCTRPPQVADDVGVKQEDAYASAPVYVLVCVSWTHESVNWHQSNQNMNLSDLGEHCNAVGGVGGWPCASNPLAPSLRGVTDGIIDVDTKAGTVAGVEVPNASFSGTVTLRACLDWPGTKENTECVASAVQMSQWPCRKCKSMTDTETPETLIYNTFPRMEVLLQGVQLGSGENQPSEEVPRAYVLTSSRAADGPDGTWTKLYEANPAAPGPRPWLEEEEEEEGAEEGTPEKTTTTTAPVVHKPARFKMAHQAKNSLTLKPSWCFGERGPLYLVACAVNSSTYQDKFMLSEGQLVAPPPFNDRCLAVTGRCAYACMEQQTPGLEKCGGGVIPQSELSGDYADESFEMPSNEGSTTDIFMFVLLLGFAVKLVTYFPGLFIAYRHESNYKPQLTGQFRYIAVCCPGAGETKACMLRNLVGAISAMPDGCMCRFHVVFVDEGHRHPQKIMFRFFAKVLDKVPDVCMSGNNGKRSPRRSRTGFKEENLKLFTKFWVEQTRMCRLEGCNTDKIAQQVVELRRDSPEGSRQIDELEARLDALCGLKALRTLQARSGWPKGSDEVYGAREIAALEAALKQLRGELCAGEKEIADPASMSEAPKPMHHDDCEQYSWHRVASPDPDCPPPKPLYTVHYVSRAKPDEDERTLKVQHVARGVWYYKVPQEEDRRSQKTWLEWRQSAQEFQDGDFDRGKYVVPLRTSRGKAGGLNFAENYLFDYSCRQELEGDEGDPSAEFKHSLFSIADARHQFQPDFFRETIPFFFPKGGTTVNSRVSFTQCPRYFPETPDDVDYLDTNNSNFFRLNCMLRNCCGGVSSCGTNGTWLIRDRRAGVKGTSNIWDTASIETRREGFEQMIEHRIFHERCKVEDAASSLDRVVKGKYSQYINRRLAYGMAEDPEDYLAWLQRWAEGGVVLSLQTFLGREQGIHMIWMTFILFLCFVGSLFNMVYGTSRGMLSVLSDHLTGSDSLTLLAEDFATAQADLAVQYGIAQKFAREQFAEIFLECELWLLSVVFAIVLMWLATTLSYVAHTSTCCGRRKAQRRTRFPVSLAQWARLAITMDNLTYFLWFWTAFFWVAFNYYSVFFPKTYNFEATGITMFSWVLQVLSWLLVITATYRYRMDQSMAANEVFFLGITNIWRTTQLFYITAPLTLYSLITGFTDFLKNRMLGVDISYRVGGDRGAASKALTRWWTLLLVLGMVVTNVLYWTGLCPPHAEFINILIVTFIGLDVLHPCCFLWLGVDYEKLPTLSPSDLPAWRQCVRRCCQLIVCVPFYRNCMRWFAFHPSTAVVIRLVGPVQHVMFPFLTYFMPELAINQALLLLASVK